MLIREKVSQIILSGMKKAQNKGEIPVVSFEEPIVERPSNPEHGDFASSVPLRLSRLARMAPLEIANILLPYIDSDDSIDEIWVQPPGFINFRLKDQWLIKKIDDVLENPESFGNTETFRAKKVQVEFVSANPTGPLHVGTARGAVIGSTLANILEAAGYRVEREYYINDAGLQIRLFYESVFVRYAQKLGDKEIQLPDGGYQGQYLVGLTDKVAEEYGDRFLKIQKEEAITTLGEIGLQLMLKNIRQDLADISVEFDNWFNESDLFTSGQYQLVLDLLKNKGYSAEREGALWFTSTALGEDKDNVLIRSNGLPTYFASDVAYHYDKFNARNFDKVIDIWGADHQGHVPRMKAVMNALDIDPDRLTILISQLVTLKRGEETVRASKRTGELVTLRELITEVGPDACRYFFLSRAADSQMEFDMELALKQSSENPVYYIQYAHARIAGILRQASERKIEWSNAKLDLLVHEAEVSLVRKMLQLPEVIDNSAQKLTPQALARYSNELAAAFHWFYDNCRVISVSTNMEDLEVSKARLKLIEAAKVVLKRALRIMGMNAPETM
tara:strand:- start:484 stop:2163 length:1680 start_codon:yes stop_codon:yes gene_type:complete